MSDYIDRAALGIGLCNRDVFENKGYADGWNAAVKILKEAPAADVQAVKHGKWKLCYEDWRMQIAGDECSACGFQHYGTCISHYHYCPNCGAKMEDANNAER
jgi:predicted Zn-ribbon and HTH transcriptional regulator